DVAHVVNTGAAPHDRLRRESPRQPEPGRNVVVVGLVGPASEASIPYVLDVGCKTERRIAFEWVPGSCPDEDRFVAVVPHEIDVHDLVVLVIEGLVVLPSQTV